MSAPYQALTLDWHGIAVSVAYCPDWCAAWKAIHGHALCHIEATSAGRVPMPISATGYRSMFVSAAVLDEWGGPLPYVRAALDMEARSPEWIERDATRQLSLF